MRGKKGINISGITLRSLFGLHLFMCFCLYTGSLNNPGLNCMGPVTHRFLAMVKTSAPRDLSAVG